MRNIIHVRQSTCNQDSITNQKNTLILLDKEIKKELKTCTKEQTLNICKLLHHLEDFI